MAYTKQTFTAGQTLKASDLNTMSQGIVEKQDKLISGTNLKTVNGQSLLGSGNVTVSGNGAVANKELKILFIGNSLTQDAVSYLPLLLDEVAPEVNYTIYDWYNGGHTLAQQYSKFTSNTPCDMFGTITNNQSGGWNVQNKTVTMAWVCENCDFDIVVVQEYSYYDFNDATEITNFNNVINYLRNNYGKPFKVYSFIDAPMRNRIDNDYAKAKKYAKLHITKATAEGLVNPGSAVVYGIRDSVLNTLGDRGNLTSDGTHTQEGLPCMLQSYVLALWAFEWLGIPKSILNSSTKMTADLYASWQSFGPNLGSGVVEGTEAQVKRAQEVAIKAYKNGKLLLNSYLNAMAEESSDAIPGGSSSGGGSSGGDTGGDAGGSEPEVPSTPSDSGLSVYEEGVIFSEEISVGSYCEFVSNQYTEAYDIYSYPVDGTSTYTVNTNNALSSSTVDYPYIIVVCDANNKAVKLIKSQTNKSGARMETYTVDTSTITGAKYLLISAYQDKITVTKDTGGDPGGDSGGDDTGGDVGGNEPDVPPTPSDTGLSIYQERVIFSDSEMEVGSYCKYVGNSYTGVYDIYSYPVDGVSTYTIELTNALNNTKVDYPYIIAVCGSDLKVVELIKAQTNKSGARKETYVVDTSTIPGAKYLLLSVYNDQITIS